MPAPQHLTRAEVVDDFAGLLNELPAPAFDAALAGCLAAVRVTVEPADNGDDELRRALDDLLAGLGPERIAELLAAARRHNADD